MKIKISPSLMCMDISEFNYQIEVMNDVADFYHVDIMDGHFVDNITLSPLFVNSLKKIAAVPVEAHLMVEKPEKFISRLIDSGADIISVHAEVINGKAFRLFEELKKSQCRVGVVLNPETPISGIEIYLHRIDFLTVMTVDPGFAGQNFLNEVLDKIADLKKIKIKNHYNYVIQIDGACNKGTYKKLIEAGAEILVLGSSGLFNLDSDIKKAWNKMEAELAGERDGS